MKITSDFSSERMQARREGNELFSVKGKEKKKINLEFCTL